MTPCDPELGRGFDHCLFVYHGRDDYLRGVGTFVREGLERNEAVIAVLPSENLELLCDHLGAQAASLEMFDMREVGRNPARLIPAFVARARSTGHRRLRVVGEPTWPGRDPDEVDEVLIHEALCNVVLGSTEIAGLCPYDGERLDPAVIAAATATHPRLAQPPFRVTNPKFLPNRWPEALRPLDDPPAGAAGLDFRASDLGTVRWMVDRQAERIGLDRLRRSDLVLAVNEVATNSLEHGGGSGALKIWSSPDRVTVEIRDAGQIVDPAAGRLAPESAAVRGRGVWLANQLCELVQMRSGRHGTTMRLRMARPA